MRTICVAVRITAALATTAHASVTVIKASTDRSLTLIERPAQKTGVWTAVRDRLRRATA